MVEERGKDELKANMTNSNSQDWWELTNAQRQSDRIQETEGGNECGWEY